jgi:hypothetical protein
VYDLGAGITENRGKDLFGPPAIPDVACNFSIIPEMCFHKGQDRPDSLVVRGKGGASEGKEIEINLSTVKVT